MTDDDAVSDLTLRDLLLAAAEDLADVRRVEDGDVVTWQAGGVAFAALSGARAEFRLDTMVARAALRTPDTAPSSRGDAWVAFRPETLDDTAVDRAEAWFLSAHRRAAARPDAHG